MCYYLEICSRTTQYNIFPLTKRYTVVHKNTHTYWHTNFPLTYKYMGGGKISTCTNVPTQKEKWLIPHTRFPSQRGNKCSFFLYFSFSHTQHTSIKMLLALNWVTCCLLCYSFQYKNKYTQLQIKLWVYTKISSVTGNLHSSFSHVLVKTPNFFHGSCSLLTERQRDALTMLSIYIALWTMQRTFPFTTHASNFTLKVCKESWGCKQLQNNKQHNIYKTVNNNNHKQAHISNPPFEGREKK